MKDMNKRLLFETTQRAMPSYEVVMIVRSLANGFGDFGRIATDKAAHARLLRYCATEVLDSNGVVRKFVNLGKRTLPYRMKKHQQIFEHGQYFSMQFDAAPSVMQNLSRGLSLNEHVIRHTTIKVGDSLKTTTTYIPPERM